MKRTLALLLVFAVLAALFCIVPLIKAEEKTDIWIDYINEKVMGLQPGQQYRYMIYSRYSYFTADESGGIGIDDEVFGMAAEISTVDEHVATIDIPARPSPPVVTASDGTISGVSAAMQFQSVEKKYADDNGWLDFTGSEIWGLASASYYVRVKATETSFVSESVAVFVTPGIKHVCQIGEIGYTSISDALKTIAKGSSATVTLLCDAAFADTKYPDINGFDVDFDLGGHTLYLPNGIALIFAKVSFKNGSIAATYFSAQHCTLAFDVPITITKQDLYGYARLTLYNCFAAFNNDIVFTDRNGLMEVQGNGHLKDNLTEINGNIYGGLFICNYANITVNGKIISKEAALYVDHRYYENPDPDGSEAIINGVITAPRFIDIIDVYSYGLGKGGSIAPDAYLPYTTKEGYLTYLHEGCTIWARSEAVFPGQTPIALPTPSPVPTPLPIPGDINGDGKVNILDILLVRDLIFGIRTPTFELDRIKILIGRDVPDISAILAIRDIIFAG